MAVNADEDWSDVIQYTRRPLSQGGSWVCTLHMHDAENILIGEGETREEAYRSAIIKAGKLRRYPTWPLTAALLALALFAAIHGGTTNDLIQALAGMGGVFLAIRLLLMRI